MKQVFFVFLLVFFLATTAMGQVPTTFDLFTPGMHSGDFDLDGSTAAFWVSELAEGSDLNGDADLSDVVLHVFDAETGEIENLGLASFEFELQDGVLAFLVEESRQGNQDLNGDLDRDDKVLHVRVLETHTTINLELAVRFGFELATDSGLVAFKVWELGQGENLNGDADLFDRVVHVYDTATGVLRNLQLAGEDFILQDGVLAFQVSEMSQGPTQLNNDADFFDAVLHIYDDRTGTVANLELAASLPQLAGRLAAFAVPEISQGGARLNDDGDGNDFVLHVLDLDTGLVTNVRKAVSQFVLSEQMVLFAIREFNEGETDLNGDGDHIGDQVVHIYDIASDTTTNLQISTGVPTRMAVSGQLGAFVVIETLQGVTDLNGDGDTDDHVLHLFDAATGELRNLGVDVFSSLTTPLFDIQLDSSLLVYKVSEIGQQADLNGDGEIGTPSISLDDAVLHFFDVSTRNVTNSMLAGDFLSLGIADRRLAFRVYEGAQNTDLNGDGDTIDWTIHVVSADGEALNLGLATFSAPQRSGDFVAFLGSESAQGADLNGDGDARDSLVYIAHLRPLTAQEAVDDLIDDVLDLGLPQGPETALLSKLEQAIAALERGDLDAAEGLLGAFINLVQAQSGNKIPTEEADALIEAAEQVLTQIAALRDTL